MFERNEVCIEKYLFIQIEEETILCVDDHTKKKHNPNLTNVIGMPGGQLPVLEIDGIKIGQSITIARFLANKFNLSGKNEIENAQADMILDYIQDIGNGNFFYNFRLCRFFYLL